MEACRFRFPFAENKWELPIFVSPVFHLYFLCRKGTVTLCSAFSKASCQSLDDERGVGLLPEVVGVLVGITKCEKSPTKSSSGDGGGKMLRGGTAPPRSFRRRPICQTAWVRW